MKRKTEPRLPKKKATVTSAGSKAKATAKSKAKSKAMPGGTPARGMVPYHSEKSLSPEFYREIAETLKTARTRAYRAIDSLMVEAYWNVGRRIVEEEQQGKERAGYGTSLLRHLSIRLTEEFGTGFGERNLRNFRQFYLCFPIRNALRAESPNPDSTGVSDDFPLRNTLCSESEKGRPESDSSIRGAACPELSWTHYRLLIRVENEAARQWYATEAAEQNWSSRALARQIHSLYYERLLSSKDKQPVIEEMREKTAPLAPSPRDFIRDPVVLEFLDIPAGTPGLRESRLEQAIIDKLRQFLLELGSGFAFVARQQRVRTETKDFFIDLVFYHYILKCFVLIDLKMGELSHADIGQMDMYVRLYEDSYKGKDDNPTVGLILCTEKDQTVVKYSILHESRQLFASRYQLHLPSEEELRRELERERDQILREDARAYGEREEWE